MDRVSTMNSILVNKKSAMQEDLPGIHVFCRDVFGLLQGVVIRVFLTVLATTAKTFDNLRQLTSRWVWTCWEY